MPAYNVVVGQWIIEGKVARARTFRRAMTEPERALWQALRGNRLNGLHVRRQQIIDGFIVDFYCHAAALVIEIDGPSHAEQPEYDAERDRILAARGLRILRVTNAEVLHDLSAVLARIAATADLSPDPSPTRGGVPDLAAPPAQAAPDRGGLDRFPNMPRHGTSPHPRHPLPS